jgi:hypothetical protein
MPSAARPETGTSTFRLAAHAGTTWRLLAAAVADSGSDDGSGTVPGWLTEQALGGETAHKPAKAGG